MRHTFVFLFFYHTSCFHSNHVLTSMLKQFQISCAVLCCLTTVSLLTFFGHIHIHALIVVFTFIRSWSNQVGKLVHHPSARTKHKTIPIWTGFSHDFKKDVTHLVIKSCHICNQKIFSKHISHPMMNNISNTVTSYLLFFFFYKHHLYFFQPIDVVFENHVIAEHFVASEIECGYRCMRESNCVSFNYEDHSESLPHMCEINDERQQNDPASIIVMVGFSYFELQVTFICATMLCI